MPKLPSQQRKKNEKFPIALKLFMQISLPLCKPNVEFRAAIANNQTNDFT